KFSSVDHRFAHSVNKCKSCCSSGDPFMLLFTDPTNLRSSAYDSASLWNSSSRSFM
ncbi:unnamed protein product, partial [Brachionus calyciflorus]